MHVIYEVGNTLNKKKEEVYIAFSVQNFEEVGRSFFSSLTDHLHKTNKQTHKPRPKMVHFFFIYSSFTVVCCSVHKFG